MNTRSIGLLVVVLVVGLATGYGAGTVASGAHVVTSILTQSMTATQTAMVGQRADITIVVEGHSGGSLGPDGKTHDTMMPSNFTVYVGQTVDLTFINYDEGPHSFTSTDLGVNFLIPGHVSAGVPSVSHFQFTPTKVGVFRWSCTIPCDEGQGGWAMTTGKDGGMGQLGFMAGYLTVLSS